MEPRLYIPVLLGTARQGRASEPVANWILEQARQRPEIETELLDVRQIPMRLDDAGETMKDPVFSQQMTRADGLIIVTPEYNHGYPGLLKHALDMNLKEYIHKAVGICGVSASGFGGARVIQNLLPVLRELGLVTIFYDGNFSDAPLIFDDRNHPKDARYAKQMNQFLDELVWMAKTLRYGRENFPRT